MEHTILIINTGSTSTKLAVYKGKTPAVQKEYSHDKDFLRDYPFMADQLPMRQQIARQFVLEEAAPFAPFDAIVARGGILSPIHSGGYVINDAMIDYLVNTCTEEHASNVAAVIARELAGEFCIPKAFIYDGITTNELTDIAKVSGIPEMPRISVTHALNMRATAHRVAENDLKKPYGESTIIVAHLGGGISLSLHNKGNVDDVVCDDEGPFSPERCGGQQSIPFIKLLETKGSLKEKVRMVRGGTGLAAYFGTNNAKVLEERANDGDQDVARVFDAMGYQVCKAAGGLATVAEGQVDAIALTGGLARSKRLVEQVRRRTAFIAPLFVYPGENEMESLALGANRILRGEESAREFTYSAQ